MQQCVSGGIESLLPAYQQQPHGWSASNEEGCSPSGFFFESRADLFAHLAARCPPSRAAPPTLQPSPAPATSLDYRYSVGADGEVVDMIRLKQAVPKPFERAVVAGAASRQAAAAAACNRGAEEATARMGSRGGYLAQQRDTEVGKRDNDDDDDILFDGEELSGGFGQSRCCLHVGA